MTGRRRWALRGAAVLAAALAGAVAAGTGGAFAGGGGVPAPPPAVATAVTGPASPAPPFTASLVGRPGRLASRSLAGGAVLLAFWSSSCPPCHQELRELQTAWQGAPPGLRVVGVDVADRGPAAATTLRRAGVNYPNVADPSGAIARAYGVDGTPTLVAVDRRGEVVTRLLGLASPAQIHALMLSMG